MTKVPIGELNDLGRYIVVKDSATHLDVFLCRVQIKSVPPPGVIDRGGRQYIVGFSRKCTYLGCTLITEPAARVGELPTKDGLLFCRCHSSCFDLANQGLPVIGPATDCLAMIKLLPTPNPNEVEIGAALLYESRSFELNL